MFFSQSSVCFSAACCCCLWLLLLLLCHFMLHSWRRSLGIACFIDCAQFSSWWGVSHAINVARITAASFDQGNFPSSCSSNTSNNSNNSQWQQQLPLLLWPVASGRQAGRQSARLLIQSMSSNFIITVHGCLPQLVSSCRCQLPVAVAASCCCCCCCCFGCSQVLDKLLCRHKSN